MRMSESPTIDIGDNIRLLGTAHVASASVAAVKEQVELFKPDVIAVELCESRHSALPVSYTHLTLPTILLV